MTITGVQDRDIIGDDGRTLKRRIKMHEFLMTGGVQTGYNDKGEMTYSGPITVVNDPVCPWHGLSCEAWQEIVAGRGEWTAMEAELAQAQGALEVEKNESQLEFIKSEIDRLTEKLEMRPRDAKQLRGRTPEQIEAERKLILKMKKSNVYAAAGPKTGGNPWDRKEIPAQARKVRDDWNDNAPMWSGKPYTPPEPEADSRNDAVAAFAGEEVPDEIVVEGDEGDEGDEGEEEEEEEEQ